MMNNNWVQYATTQLTEAGIATARLDALVLLEDCLHIDRAQLLAHPEHELSAEQELAMNAQIERRKAHEPLAYIRGKTEFYGREFVITKAVLEPRPESETMIELLKKLPQKEHAPRIADVGAGSGALGITAALELSATVDLLEIDRAAIKVTKINVVKHATKNRIIQSDLLASAPQQYDVLLCNLPYVPDNFYINPAAMNEPKIAIFGGADGLDLYRRLFEQLKNTCPFPQYVLTESLPPQHKKLAQVANAVGFKLGQTDDFIQLFIRA